MEIETITNKEKKTSLNYTEMDFIYITKSVHGEDLASPLDTLVCREWAAADAAGAFNYSVGDVDTKVLNGKYGIVAQINVNRKILRRKPDTILEIVQPVNPSKFNFTKIQSKEVLTELQFLPSKQENTYFGEEEENRKTSQRATMIINNAPICRFHSLVIPFLEECWPQVLNHESIATAVHTILLSKSPDVRIAFNSLGAQASVNHLHFHYLYLPYHLYVETAECEKLSGPCHIFKNHFAPGFIFELESRNFNKLVRSVMTLVNVFLNEKVAHNLFMTRGIPLNCTNTSEATYSTVRVMLWPRKFVVGAKNEDFFNVAAFEFAGHVPVYSSEHWEALSESELLPLITSVCKTQFETLLPKVINAFQ